MPIPVRCQCGQSFSAKDELAGRTVKCPKCQSPLTIPKQGNAAPAAAKGQPAARPQPTAAARAAVGSPVVPIQQPAAQDYGLAPPVPVQTPTNSLLADLLDDAGMASAHKGEQECPNCRKPMPRGAILCIKCGYHLQHRMKIQGVAQKGEADAHGDVATTALANAAMAIDKDKEDVKKETGEGLPWYAIGAMLIGVIGFITAMLLIPPQMAFTYAGITLIVLGWMIVMYGQIMIYRNAINESMMQFVLVFLFGPYELYYIFSRWDRNGGFFSLWFLGFTVQLAGGGMMYIAPMMKGEEKEAFRLDQARPAMVCSLDRADGKPLERLVLRAGRTPAEFV